MWWCDGRYLSSQQALGDLVHFHGFISTTHNLTSRHKWVTWGGSYPGMMAAYARQLHPSLFHAAVSSSSPLRITLDFPQAREGVSGGGIRLWARGGSVCWY